MNVAHVNLCSDVFDGDFVDRGGHQPEVVCLLFALKLTCPSRVWLTRGNHEFRGMNEAMGPDGFNQALAKVLRGSDERGQVSFEAVHGAFDFLPVAALVEDAVLVLHGGTGDGSWGPDHLRNHVPRPVEDAAAPGVGPHVLHALWSDPSDSGETLAPPGPPLRCAR